uniref:C-type lectin domain-containing protein n=2 Tax=Poecilia formosa TaxID=48698 RepID=A0A087YD07_POEFO
WTDRDRKLDCSCRTEDASCCLQTTQISTEIYSSWFTEGFVFEDLTCEAGWEKHGGSLYYFNTSKSSWTDSRRSCADLGSDLVKIDSREEQVFLIGRVRDLMKDNQDKFWIGLTDSKEEGKWLWMDGSALDQSLSFWNQTQPDNKSPAHSAEAEADYVRMGKKEKKGGSDDLKSWFDTSCKRPQKSICEKTAKLSSSV